jgi:hypothetical protein
MHLNVDPQKKEGGQEMTLKAILGIVMLVLVVGGLIVMKLKNRK